MGKRYLGWAAILFAVGLASGCSSSPEATCNEVSTNICLRLSQCNAMSSAFLSSEQCVASFNGFFEVGNSDDAACRVEWAAAQGLDCADFIDRYKI